jgi:hypothetical protein
VNRLALLFQVPKGIVQEPREDIFGDKYPNVQSNAGKSSLVVEDRLSQDGVLGEVQGSGFISDSTQITSNCDPNVT